MLRWLKVTSRLCMNPSMKDEPKHTTIQTDIWEIHGASARWQYYQVRLQNQIVGVAIFTLLKGAPDGAYLVENGPVAVKLESCT